MFLIPYKESVALIQKDMHQRKRAGRRPENALDGKNRVENYDFSMVYAPVFNP